MSAFQSKIYRLETQLAELQHRISDDVSSDTWERTGLASASFKSLTIIENFANQLSLNHKNHKDLRYDKLVDVIAEARDSVRAAVEPLESDGFNSQLSDLSWLIGAKASIHTLAILLDILTEKVILLSEEITYWDGILEFDWCVGLYALQVSPFKVWQRYREIGRDDSSRVRSVRIGGANAAETNPRSGIWLKFYSSIYRCTSPGWTFRIGLTPHLKRSKLEIQHKRKKLKSMRDFNASAIGLLVEECLSLKEDVGAADSSEFTNNILRQYVISNVNLMKMILQSAETGEKVFEHAKSTVGENDGVSGEVQDQTPAELTDSNGIHLDLIYILRDLLPRYKSISAETTSIFGRPSSAVRYWLPVSLTLVSATTLLKIFRNVGPVVIDSISNFGFTALEFWKNWVVEPAWKLIRTIRHDEKSEIALMSKNSLQADRESLERMVVDFVLDRDGQSHHSSSAASILAKVREGDLTPVLKAYEKDLRSPFLGTFRGDLVRALLIQIQKTKVDVEVAMSGIDALLKSQELVFGFVGLTPGLLISYASLQWFLGVIGKRKGFRMGRRQDDLRYALRSIHRILSTSSVSESGRLTYRDHGLLICNAEIILHKARSMLKGRDLRAFQDDISDLLNEHRADKQLHIAERMAWTYSKWT
ncbi:ATP synthase regulation protein NCA2-domain-containing protein [Aspergillus karnatakaensis]|uniref:NCA2 family protein n=1 Tax=Aspergillus karnatakaensis TaxID=1810916 RepID=UPI003CCE47C7